MTKASLGRAVALAALAPIAVRLADEHEREKKEIDWQRQFEHALAGAPALERPAPPNTWVGELWDPGRVVRVVAWVLGKAFLWSILLANVGMLVSLILFGSEAMVTVGAFLGIGASLAIAAHEPVKELLDEAERRRCVAEEKDTYTRAAKAFDDREAERAAIRMKFDRG